MRQPHSTIRIFLVSGLACALASTLPLSACESSDEPPDDGGPPETVDTIALDGLVLMRTSGGPAATGPSFFLRDTNTAKDSAEVFVYSSGLSSMPAFEVAPDGQSVAYILPSGTEVGLATFGLDGDTPTLTVAKTWPVPSIGKVHWSPDGDRFAVGPHIVDPTTEVVLSCSGMLSIGESGDLTMYPGGAYFCPGDDTLERDGRVIADDLQSDGAFVSSDAQLFDAFTHLPTAARRTPPDGFAYDNELNNFGRRLARADGTFATYPTGVHGSFVVESAAGFVTLYSRLEWPDPPLDGHIYDLVPVFRDGTFTKGAEVPVSDAIVAWFTDGEGRRFGTNGFTGDDRVIYGVRSHVITSDPYTNVLYESPVETAIVEVAPDGTTRGFKTSEVGGGFVYLGPDDKARPLRYGNVVEYADGDWLTTSGFDSSRVVEDASRIAWIGYLGGEPYFSGAAGQMTQDGTHFLEGFLGPALGSPGTLCVRPVKRSAQTQCMPGSPLFEQPYDLVAQGIHGGSGKPVIREVSRRAAWPGATVVVFGARFGASGTLKVGDVTVPAEAITGWSDHRISFTMHASLPDNGRVVVTTAEGDSSNRVFWLARTEALTTPFDGATTEVVPLGQGQNLVDLGALTGFAPIRDELMRLDEAMKLADGRFVVHSSGATTTTTHPVDLTIAPFYRRFDFRLEDRSADATKWQVTRAMGNFDLQNQEAGFVYLAGDLVTIGATHVVEGARVTEIGMQQRIPNTVAAMYGMPNFWREREEGAWVTNHLLNYGGSAALIVDWIRPESGEWGTPQFASGVGFSGNYLAGIDAIGDVVLAVGNDPMGVGGAAFTLSTDGGATFGPYAVTAGVDQAGLAEPIAIAASSPYFIAFESGYGGGDVFGVHRVDLDGTVTLDVAPAPTMLKTVGAHWHAPSRPFELVNVGERLMIYAPASKTLVSIDLAAAEPSWQIWPSAADRAKVRAMYHDSARGEVVVTTLDGVVKRATDASGWSDWSDVDFGFDLPLPTRIHPVAVARLGDGAWLVHAALFDASAGVAPETPSPLGPSSWLVGPRP